VLLQDAGGEAVRRRRGRPTIENAFVAVIMRGPGTSPWSIALLERDVDEARPRRRCARW
jgi:hypothetical protein